MIQTRQNTSIETRDISTSSSASSSDIVQKRKNSTTMNEIFDTFDTQIIEASEISNYAALQRELNQLNAKRERVKLLREMQRVRIAKIARFSDETSFALTNRILIDDFQKKKLFKIVNSKKYKSITQHDLNIFIRKCNEMFEIRKNIYANDKNKILFARSFLDDVSTEN